MRHTSVHCALHPPCACVRSLLRRRSNRMERTPLVARHDRQTRDWNSANTACPMNKICPAQHIATARLEIASADPCRIARTSSCARPRGEKVIPIQFAVIQLVRTALHGFRTARQAKDGVSDRCDRSGQERRHEEPNGALLGTGPDNITANGRRGA